MRESAIQTEVVAWARSLRVRSRKLSWGEGWPDYIFLYQGNCCFIEFKAPGETPKPLQRYMIRELELDGFHVWVVDDIQQGKIIIKDWKDGIDAYREQVGRVR